MSLLFNPRNYTGVGTDPETAAKLTALINFFEDKGNGQMLSEYDQAVWYADFLEFAKDNNLLGHFGTPAEVGQLIERPDARWDTARINDFNEILGFYSLAHWYAWQVSVLGLGPVWTSDNTAAQAVVGELLNDGAIFGFGLSEKRHGADIYSTDVELRRTGDGWAASGPKYYIGNGNEAGRLSVFGKFADDDPEYPGEYVFFLVDTKHEAYHLEKNVVNSQMYVAAFSLDNYPVTTADILHTGQAAFDAALATVNVGKVNLGWASIGICEHAFYEAITHADNRVLYGNKVTDFPHVQRLLSDSYARLIAMKVFAARSADYFRSASAEDRRFLLFNPITKAKVTSEGERVIDLLWDVIAARGFEKDMYFHRAASEIRALPKLEGTVHVNIALVLKFLPMYLGAAHGAGIEVPATPIRQDAADDEYLFQQGPARGLGKIGFPDWRPSFERFQHLPNVAVFQEQIAKFTQFVMSNPPSEGQQKDLDYLQALGQLFTQIVYAQLIAESAALAIDGETSDSRPGTVSDLSGLTEAHVDRMFSVFVRDMNEYATALYGQSSASSAQRASVLRILAEPISDVETESTFYKEVLNHNSAYIMNP